jgi:hypothetical protein
VKRLRAVSFSSLWLLTKYVRLDSNERSQITKLEKNYKTKNLFPQTMENMMMKNTRMKFTRAKRKRLSAGKAVQKKLKKNTLSGSNLKM